MVQDIHHAVYAIIAGAVRNEQRLFAFNLHKASWVAFWRNIQVSSIGCRDDQKG